MAFIDGTALNVALPAVQSALHATGVQLLWVVNAYLLMLAALIPVGGSLGDLLGRKKVFAAGIGLFVLASLVCGISPDHRLPHRRPPGAGRRRALMIPGSLPSSALSIGPSRAGRPSAPGPRRPPSSPSSGPILGGVLAGAGLWRLVFLINLPLGVAAITGLLLKVPESRNEQSSGRIDYLGAGLLAVGLAALTYGFISAPDMGFGDPKVLAALAVGRAGLGVLRAWWKRGARTP